MDQTATKALDRSQLQQHFRNHDPAQHSKLWDSLWQNYTELPWDRGEPSIALVDALVDHQDVFVGPLFPEGSDPSGAVSRAARRKRALVPGCGMGYDVLSLASFGYDVWGLDVSETVVEKAREFAAQHAGEAGYAARDEEVRKGAVEFVCGDFFGDERIGQVEGKGFDLIFDYTVCRTILSYGIFETR